MERHSRIIMALVLSLAIFPAPMAWAETDVNRDADTTGTGVADRVCPSGSMPPEEWSKTQHRIKALDPEIPYSATVGALPVTVQGEKTNCRVCFTCYERENRNSTARPITFIFNGGPGASAAYLHLGAIGPIRVAWGDRGAVPSPPPQLEENADTWLPFTDLVFVDPVGTGYSRCCRAGNDREKPPDERPAWGVREDLEVLAQFIRLYLTRTSRWLSPLFLVGESYGGFRVAALAALMQREHGILPNGLILVSPALEFAALNGNDYRLLPWVVTLPSFAATAGFHGKTQARINRKPYIRKQLRSVESFAVNEFLPALAWAEVQVLSDKLVEFIGLPERRIALLRGRVSPSDFARLLLHSTERVVSLYDGSRTAVDPSPGGARWPYPYDPLLLRINTLLAAAANSVLRDQLGYKTDVPYEVLNEAVSREWHWTSGVEGRHGFAGAAGALKDCMSANRGLKVWIAHGVYDLVTPYFSSALIVKQMALDPVIAANLQLRVYEGGHMFYTHAASLQDFSRDAAGFYRGALSGH